MKKIIGNLIYDTDKAEKVFSLDKEEQQEVLVILIYMNGLKLMYTKHQKETTSFMVM